MSAGSPIDDEAREDAVDVLRDLLVWQLAPERWARVETIVDALADALDREDGDALREATAELEVSGPVRITRIGARSPGPVPASARIRDRANHLVHSLGQPPRPGRGDGERQPSGGDGDGSPTPAP
ncbi:CATRA system-associated protein [Streptomyces antibioticus]|uniref:CATRA system-associated protein n=1 Tax=Streptomyces antibioticus TaxID=1890 RepID=UPI003411E224